MNTPVVHASRRRHRVTVLPCRAVPVGALILTNSGEVRECTPDMRRALRLHAPNGEVRVYVGTEAARGKDATT